jgi:hypothetical protein
MSRGIRILVGVAAVTYIAALGVVVYTLSEQQSADTRITRAEKFDPCVSLSEAVANKAADRIKPLTRECREFLNGIGPLVTIKLSCAIIEKARYICPAPGTEPGPTTRRGGVPLGPSLTTSSAPNPSSGDGSSGTPGGTKTSPKSQKPPTTKQAEFTPPPHTTTATPPAEPTSTAPPASSTPTTSEVEQPGLVSPALETVCSLADHLLNLC